MCQYLSFSHARLQHKKSLQSSKVDHGKWSGIWDFRKRALAEGTPTSEPATDHWPLSMIHFFRQILVWAPLEKGTVVGMG